MEGNTLLAVDKASREERRRVQSEGAQRLIESGMLDDLFARIDAGEVQLDGDGGFVQQLIKTGLERGLQAELTEHVGYEKGDPEARLHENSRNGSFPKTMGTTAGEVELRVPRDRNGTFTPRLVPTGSRRLSQLDEMIVSLYAGGMTVRDIEHHLVGTLGVGLSHETISNITEEIAEEVLQWQNRPLEAFYPVIYLDALVIKVRDGGHVRNKGRAYRRLRRRAHRVPRGDRGDLARIDGPNLRGASDPQRDAVRGLRAAQGRRRGAQADLPSPERGRRAGRAGRVQGVAAGAGEPSAAQVFEDAWERFAPFLAFPPELRRVIYTTNAIESLNYQLRKIIKNRGHFPNDQAAVKLLWLAICNIEDKRARDRASERGLRRGSKRKAEGRLVQGQVVTNWMKALEQLSLVYPERINRCL